MNISLPSELKRFIDKKVKNGFYASEEELLMDALRRYKERDDLLFHNGGVSFQSVSDSYHVNYSTLASEGDIAATAFIVLMEAAKESREDLKMIMSEVKAINATKKKLRELIVKVNKDISSNVGQMDGKPPLDLSNGYGSQQAYHRVQMPYPDAGSESGVKYSRTDLFNGKLIDVEQLGLIRDDLNAKLDGLSEMGEMESLRLQMAMDRLSKLMSTVSNVLKKVNDTATTIVQNMK